MGLEGSNSSPDERRGSFAILAPDGQLVRSQSQFWPDSPAVVDALKKLEQRFTGHRQISDAYLASLAAHHRGKLATLNQRIRRWGRETVVEVIE